MVDYFDNSLAPAFIAVPSPLPTSGTVHPEPTMVMSLIALAQPTISSAVQWSGADTKAHNLKRGFFEHHHRHERHERELVENQKSGYVAAAQSAPKSVVLSFPHASATA